MSHELRTPLNAILGFSQILLRQGLAPQGTESVQYILKGGRHLLQLINEVLDLSRVEAGHIEISLEVVEVGPVVRECLELARTIADEFQVQMEESVDEAGPTFVTADRRRLQQVILNLLSNGIKYNVPGGKLSVRPRTGVDGMVLIDVTDTGRGIHPDDMARLFTPFDRLAASQSTVEGTGLGLALSRELVNLMGGRIEVESTPGLGSTFTVSLPRAALPAGLPVLSEKRKPETDPNVRYERQYSVLCIEDNPLNIRLFESIFDLRPAIALRIANTGTTGLEIALRHSPDLIILDLNLPDISGMRILETARQIEALKSTPIIVVSADATPGQIGNLLRAGANRYLTKPIDVVALLEAVDEALGLRLSEDSA